MDPGDAIALLVDRFPVLVNRVDDPSDLWAGPHFAYNLLATEALEHQSDKPFLEKVVGFINELADSGDDLLEEVLVVDVLEGVAQDPELLEAIKPKMNSKAANWLKRVETEFFGRGT